jgi:hypothetical protein
VRSHSRVISFSHAYQQGAGNNPGAARPYHRLPEYAIGWDKGDLLLRNYEGNVFRYPDNHAETKDIH